MIARLLIPGLLAMLLAPTLASAQDYFGTYSYVKGQRGDQKIPDEKLKNNTVKIDDGELFLLDSEGTVQFEIHYILDDEPEEGLYKATLEIVKSVMEDAVGAKAKALAKAYGDTITLIYDFESQDYPTDFEPKSPSQQLFVLKKVPAGAR